MTGVTDPAGSAWAYTYDALGRRLAVSDPDLGSWSYTYDNANRLITQTDALLQKSRLTYDKLGRVLTKTARDGSPFAETVTNTYDEARAASYNVGHLTTSVSPSARQESDFDIAGQPVAQRTTPAVGPTAGTTYASTASYDIGGRLLARTYPDGDTLGTAAAPLQYDGAGRLIGIPGVLNNIQYNARGQSKVVSYANGVTSTFAYSDQRGWLNSLTHANGSGPLMALTYARAATGRINAITSASDPTESWTYTYDDLDRLLSASNLGTPAYSQSFQYDIANNMTFNSAVGAYSYPLASAPHPHAPLTAGSRTLSYDANGNIVSDGTRSFIYDGDNRPTNVSGVLYTYAPDGERLSKLDAASGALTTYLGGDVELAGGVWTKYLTSDAKRVGSGPAAVTTWLHADHLSSIRLITNALGSQLERANYRPYGQQFPGLSQSKGYIGEKFDAETGLQYLHARYYDPVIGVFLTPDDWDPSRPGVGTNRYAYCFGDPINCRDPFGNMASSGSGTKAAVQGAQNMAQASSDRGMRGIPSSTSGSSSSGCCGSGSGNGGSGSGGSSNCCNTHDAQQNSRDGVIGSGGGSQAGGVVIVGNGSGATQANMGAPAAVLVGGAVAGSISRSAILDGIIAGGAIVEVTVAAGVVAVVCVTVCAQNDVRGRPGEMPPRLAAEENTVDPASGATNSGQRPTKTPNTGVPGSTYVNPGSGQVRIYGPDGRPLSDIDSDHDHGQGVPHQHDWVDGVRGPGVPVKRP